MAESADVSRDVTEENKDKSSTEELSKPESEKQVKKYLNYLQKAKAKCDELGMKCISLEKERDAANEIILKWRNENNAEYIEELRYEIKELKKKIPEQSGEKSAPNEDFEVIKAARDTAIHALKKITHKLASTVTENQNNLSEIERLKEFEAEFRKQVHEKSVLEVNLREQLSAKDALETDLKQQLGAKGALEVGLRERLSVTSTLEADFREQLDAKGALEVALREQLEAKGALEADLREQLNAKGALEVALREQLDAKDALEADLREQLSAKIALDAQDLENTNEKLTAECNDLSKKCKDIQSEYEMIKSELEETVNEKNKLFVKNNALYEELQNSEVIFNEKSLNLKQENSKLKNENSDMVKNIDLLQQDNRTFKLMYSELEKINKKLTDSTEISKTALEEAEKRKAENSNLNAELSSLILKYADLQNKNCLVSDVQSMLLKLSCFANQAESQSLDIIEISEFICSQFEELKIKLDTLENEKLHETESKENSVSKIQELETKITDLSLTLNSHREENEILKEKLADFVEQKHLLESEYKENATRRILELQTKITDLSSKLESIVKENENLEIKLGHMQKELQQENEYKESASKQIQELKSEVTNLLLKLNFFGEENVNLKEKLEVTEKKRLKESVDKKNALRKIKEYETELSNLTLKFSSSEEENMNLKEKLEVTEKKQLQEIEDEENVFRRIQKFEAEVIEVSLKLNSSQEENKALKEKLDEFSEKEKFESNYKENTIKRIQELELEISNLSLKFSSSEEESKGLKEKLEFTEKEKLQDGEYKENISRRIQELETEIGVLFVKFNSSVEENKILKVKLKEFTESRKESNNVCCQTSVQSVDASTEIGEVVKDVSLQTDFVDSHCVEMTQLVSPIAKEVALEISEWGFAGQDTYINDLIDAKLPETSVSIQTCVDTCHASTNTDEVINEELQALSSEMMGKNIEIENLLKECENLKSQFDLKSKLVEEIHCRLDFLLAKEEELNSEIEVQNRVIKATNEQNHSLQIELDALRQLSTPLMHVRDALNEVKCMGNNIKVDVSAFNTDFVTALSNVNKDISSKYNSLYKCLEHNYIKKNSDTQEEIQCYKVFLHDTSLEIKDILGMFADAQSKGYLSNEIDYNISESFPISDSFEADQFHVFKSNFLLHCNKMKNNLHATFAIISQFAETRDDQAKELSHFKNSVVPSLKSKIQDLEHSLSNSYNTNAEADQNSNDVVKTLHKQLSETETKMNKFKAIALKWKKELAECQQKFQGSSLERDKYKEQVNEIASELDSISTTHSQYVLNFQNLQNENDKLQDAREDMKTNMKSLQISLSATQTDLQKCNENLSLMESELQKSKQLLLVAEMQRSEMEGKRNDSESKIIILEAKNSEDQNKIQDFISELVKARNDTAELMKEKDLLKQKLEDALKEGKQHSLLDLEMADYERSIEELTNKLEKRNAENDELQRDVQNLKAKIDTLQAEIKICESHRDTEEKRAAGFKEILENTKKELLNIKEHEAELQSNCAQLNLKVETLGQKGEDYKSQLSKQSAEIQRLKEMLKSSAESHHKSIRCLESKIAAQKQDIITAHKEVESVKQDFENYKIRVHSVLKQQQKNVPTITPSQTSEKDNQDAQIEKLKLQIKDLSDKLYAVTLERDSLQEKHDHLLHRYNKIVEEAELKDRNWSNRIEHVHMEKSKLQSLLQDTTTERAMQNERIAATYKKQIKILQEEHNNALKELQSQLVSADIEITQLQREQQKYISNSVTPSIQEEPYSFDMFSQERQEGEGSECTEDGNMNSKRLSLATIPTGGFMPLEKLLQSPVESEASASIDSILDPEKLNNDLTASWKKIDHLRELLNESEANNLRLGDQVRILKEEVRRLERNKQREEHAENLEYLKNVFVKFATLEPGSERAMLVPVLTTMLRLSPAEQKQMKLVAGDKNSETAAATWGSYLHRWSGT